MFCSTIIPTVGRPTLKRSVHSVLHQRFSAETFEIIVVNDSGQPIPYEPWQDSEKVHIIETAHRERSVARNTGAALARGQYLHFLDDDDWLLPNAFDHFWQHTQTHNDEWICGGTRLVDRDDNPLIELHHQFDGNSFVQVMAGEWIPLQASLIKADSFFAVGGFNPHITATEDADLCRRIALRYALSIIQEIVACVTMGRTGSTTNHLQASTQSRWAREDILNQPAVLARMRASATNSCWQGRIARIYLTSMVWNTAHRKPIIALSRAVWGGISLILAAPYLITPQYWQAFFHAYRSETFSRGFVQAPASLVAEESNSDSPAIQTWPH